MVITTRQLYEALLYNLENLADEYNYIHYMVDGKTVALNYWGIKGELERRLKKIEEENECERTKREMRHEQLLKAVTPCLLSILMSAPEEGLSAEEINTILLDKYPDDYATIVDGYVYPMTVTRIHNILKKDLKDKVIAFFNNDRKRVYRLRKEEA